MKKGFFWTALGLLTAYGISRAFMRLAENGLDAALPSDATGNYDIDGVSYDPKGHEVVVSGDATHSRAM